MFLKKAAREAALADWIDGEVVAENVDDYGGGRIVVRKGELFTVLRVFGTDDRAMVSCDLQDAPVELALQLLVRP